MYHSPAEGDGDGGTPDTGDSTPPTGDVSNDDRWVEPDELPELDIVDVRLETEPANSVYARSIITLENPSSVDRDAEVRSVLNGELIASADATVAANSRENISYTELVTEPGIHQFQANVATQTDANELVRTFDFDVGVVEVEESNCELFGYDFGVFIVCWYWWILALILAMAVYYWRRMRRDESDDDEPTSD